MSEQPRRKSGNSAHLRFSESRGKVEQPTGQFRDLFQKGKDEGKKKGLNQPSKAPVPSQKK